MALRRVVVKNPHPASDFQVIDIAGSGLGMRSLRAVSEARRRDQSPEWQRRCPARFRYSDLNGAARVCGGRGQIMGFEWGSADPPLD